MLVKLTSKNRLTLPKAVASEFPDVEHFDVAVTNGCIVLAPVRVQRTGTVRAKLAELGITQADVGKAVQWARGRGTYHNARPRQKG